jgi:hypothetical protein
LFPKPAFTKTCERRFGQKPQEVLLKVSSQKNLSPVANAQSWDDILKIYTEFGETEPLYRPFADFIRKIMQSEYRRVFFPLRTMDGLLLSLTKKIRFQQQNLLIRPGTELIFEYQDGAINKKSQWRRKCKPETAFSLLEKFVDQLHLLVKIRRA